LRVSSLEKLVQALNLSMEQFWGMVRTYRANSRSTLVLCEAAVSMPDSQSDKVFVHLSLDAHILRGVQRKRKKGRK